MLERLRLPARHRGAGLRSMAWLAPIAYCASFATAAPSFFARGGHFSQLILSAAPERH